MTELAETPAVPDSGAPLAGRSVLVTRPRRQAEGLVAPLERLGAEVFAVPMIEIVDPPDTAALSRAAREAGAYDWIVFTSLNGVERFCDAVESEHGGAPADALAPARIAVVGSATARALRGRGIEPDLLPDEFRAEGVLEGMRAVVLGEGVDCRVLYVRALEGREVLVEGLREIGCEVDLVAAYETVPAAAEPALVERLRAGSVDVVTFLSPSAVKSFVRFAEAAGLDVRAVLGSLRIASIGPVTSDAVREYGVDVAVEPEVSTVPALVEALARDAN